MVLVSRLHELDPFDGDGVLDCLVLSLQLWHLLNLLQAVDAVAPLDEEVKGLLEFLLDCADDSISNLPGVVRYLRLELTGVLVDSLDGGRVELQAEVVGEELELLSEWLASSCRSLGENGEC